MITCPPHFFPASPDCSDNLIEVCAHALCLHHQLLDVILQQPLPVAGACFRRLGHHCADAGTRFQPSFLDQVLNHLVRGVGVDLQVRRQVAHRRKRLSGSQRTAQDGTRGGEHDLVEDRFTGYQDQLEWCHNSTVTQVTARRQVR